MNKPQLRFVYLDAMRGLAAVVITYCHFWTRLIGHSPIDRVYLAVDFFFVLAGFVSCYAYEQRLLTNMSWLDFTKRRLIRLYPLYFLGLVFGLAVTVVLCLRTHEDLDQLLLPTIAHALMLPITYQVGFTSLSTGTSAIADAFPLNMVVWALAYEVFVSLFYGAIVRKLKLPVLLGVIGAFFLLYSGGAFFAGTYATGSEIAHVPPAVCRVGFSYFMGILVFRLSRPGAPNPWLWLPLTAAFYALLAFPTLPWGNRLLDAGLLVLVLPAFVYLAAKCDMPRRLEKLSRLSGDLAYPIYMLHYPIVALGTMFVAAHHIEGWGIAGVFGVTFAVILLLSVLALKYFDEPVRKWLNQVSFPKKAPAALPAGN